MLRKHINYTKKDFSSLRSELLAAKNTLTTSWTDNHTSDPGVTLLELYAYVGDMINYYIDRGVNECFIGTATQRQSVLNLSSWLGYTPSPASTAITTLQFQASDSAGFTISGGTKVTVEDGDAEQDIIFETIEDLTVASATSGTVSAVSAVKYTNEVIGTSNGLSYQKIKLPQSPLAYYNNAYDVSVDVNEGSWVTWSLQTDFSDSGVSSAHYTIETSENDNYYIVFGNNTYGKVPTNGSSIRATYRIGAGANGNNVGVGNLSKILSTDGVSANITAVTNTVVPYGGAEKESIDQIRLNLPKAVKTRYRAVTPEDYVWFCQNYAGVALSKAMTRGDGVQLIIVPENGGIPSAHLKTSLLNYINTYKMIGTKVSLMNPTYLQINIDIQISVDKGYSPSTVGANISEKIYQYLSPVKKDANGNYLNTFGKDVHVSKLYAVIEEVSGVLSAKILTLLGTTYMSDSTIPSNLDNRGNFKENLDVKDIIIKENEISMPGDIKIGTDYGTVYTQFYNPDDARAIQNMIEKVEL